MHDQKSDADLLVTHALLSGHRKTAFRKLLPPHLLAQLRREQMAHAASRRRAKVKAMGDVEFRVTLTAMEVPPGWQEFERANGYEKVVLREALIYGMKFRMRMGRTKK